MTEKRTGLTVQIAIAIVFAAFCAVVVFLFLTRFDKPVCDTIRDLFITDEYYEKICLSELDNFQQFVSENDINSYDYGKITKYTNSKPYVLIVIYDGKKPVYDSSVPKMPISRNYDENSSERTNKHIYRPLYNVKFADKETSIEFSVFIMYIVFFGVAIVKILFSFVLFLGILLLLIRCKVMYIIHLQDEVNILESGNLNYEITVKGNDELTYLAKSIDAMRLSILDKLSKEADAVSTNHKLVTAMSHDLRTPLTILLGFLEIIDNKKYSDEVQLRNYIHKSLEKAYQIKNLSDKIFEYFLAYNMDHEKLELKNYSVSILNEIIQDHIFSLKEKKFDINYVPFPRTENTILIDKNHICRVFDNIFSNVTKYADKEKEVSIFIFSFPS